MSGATVLDIGDDTGGVNVGKSTRTPGDAVCLYNTSNCISSGYECDLILRSSLALLGYTINTLSSSLRTATGGNAVLVPVTGPGTIFNISIGAGRILAVVDDVVVVSTVVVTSAGAMSDSTGVS